VTLSSTFRKSLALSAAALGLALAAPAAPVLAQTYDAGGAYNGGPDITVRAAPRAERDPGTGTDIDYVTASRVVGFGDLDLNTRWGVRELHARVVSAAADACDEISNANVVVQDDNNACIARATRDAMYRAPIGADMDGMAD
jgi:UrcA family protein